MTNAERHERLVVVIEAFREGKDIKVIGRKFMRKFRPRKCMRCIVANNGCCINSLLNKELDGSEAYSGAGDTDLLAVGVDGTDCCWYYPDELQVID